MKNILEGGILVRKIPEVAATQGGYNQGSRSTAPCLMKYCTQKHTLAACDVFLKHDCTRERAFDPRNLAVISVLLKFSDLRRIFETFDFADLIKPTQAAFPQLYAEGFETEALRPVMFVQRC